MDAPHEWDFSPLATELREALAVSSTATLATVLFGRGLRNRVVSGIHALVPGHRMVGVIRTLRYLPNREDLDTMPNWQRNDNPQRYIAETIEPGQVLMIDARQSEASGTIGGMLAIRMKMRGAAGIVSDGPFRDYPAIAGLDWPSYAAGANANTNLVAHHPEDLDRSIACGGVYVQPGDVAVGDDEGVIVIPRRLVADVAEEAAKQEQREAFIEQQILSGGSLFDWYPMREELREQYDAARREQ